MEIWAATSLSRRREAAGVSEDERWGGKVGRMAARASIADWALLYGSDHFMWGFVLPPDFSGESLILISEQGKW